MGSTSMLSEMLQDSVAFLTKDKNDLELYTNIPKGHHLTARQKGILAYWTPPQGSFSKTCGVCGGMYSAGYLRLCGESFCGYEDKVIDFTSPSPIPDHILKEWFGFDRR